MHPDRIEKIIKHAGKLLKELFTELFGEQEKEKADDKGRDTEDHWASSEYLKKLVVVSTYVQVPSYRQVRAGI